MSYCVNCGVELSPGAASCPLCDTTVLNPSCEQTELKPDYPRRMVIPPGVRKQYLGFLLTVIIGIPNVVCMLTNLLLPHTGVWSLFVFSSSFLVWTFSILPLFLKTVNPYALLGLDTLVSLVHMFVVYSLYGSNGWYFRLAVPLVLSFAFLSLIFIIWCRRKKRDALRTLIVITADIALYSFVTEICIDAYTNNGRYPIISLIIAVSCVCLMLFFRATVKNQRLKAWLTRRFYF